jgi:hypothetical protein
MKRNLKTTMNMVLLALMLGSFPMMAWATEEPKPAEQPKAAQQKQEEDKVTGELAANILSAYIWRGQELSRHSVVIEPALTASYKGFTANLWGNIDTKPYATGDQSYSSNFTETDVTLSYSRKFGMIQAGAGYIYYGLAATTPGGTDLLDSQEIFVTLGLDTILAPTLTVYKEIDHYHQWYATLGVSHTFALHEKIGLKLAAQVSYLKGEDETTYPEFDSNSVATKDKFNNLHDGVVSISLPVNVIKNLTVMPTMTYVFPLSSNAKYEMRGRGLQGTTPSDRDSSYLCGGVVMSLAF